MARKGNRSESTTLSSEDKEVRAMLNALETEDKLGSWEIEFVTSVSERWHNGKSLTESQLEKLKEVYRRYN